VAQERGARAEELERRIEPPRHAVLAEVLGQLQLAKVDVDRSLPWISPLGVALVGSPPATSVRPG
jgi:hypothetical protein